MNIAFGMIVFNGNYVLDACLETIYPYASQIVIAEGPVGYFAQKGFTCSTDGTVETIRNFPDLEHKIQMVHGPWTEKDEMCRAYGALIHSDTDFVFHVDSDEIHYPETIEKVLEVLWTGRWDSISFRSWAFYGGFDRIFGKDSFEQGFEFHRVQRWYPGANWETHRPPTVLSSGPEHRPWREHGHLAFFAGMPHYSYVWPSQVKAKTEYYRESVAPGRCIPNYFDQVYLPWVRGTEAERQAIEDKYNGTHDFLSEIRGPCRTEPFGRPHPPAIEKRLPQLRQRLEAELATY
jgi:hypothetical protein